jgi:hypothetical protein
MTSDKPDVKPMLLLYLLMLVASYRLAGSTNLSLCSLKFSDQDLKYPVENNHFLIQRLDSGILKITNKQNDTEQFYPESYHQLPESLKKMGSKKFTKLVTELGDEVRAAIPDPAQRSAQFGIFLNGQYPLTSEKGKFIRNILEPMIEMDSTLYRFMNAPRVDDKKGVISKNLEELFDKHSLRHPIDNSVVISELSFSKNGSQLHLSRPAVITHSNTTYHATGESSDPAFIIKKHPQRSSAGGGSSSPRRRVKKPKYQYHMPLIDKTIEVQSKVYPYYDANSKRLFYIDDNNTLNYVNEKGEHIESFILAQPDKMLTSNFFIKDDKAIFSGHSSAIAVDLDGKTTHHMRIDYQQPPPKKDDFILSFDNLFDESTPHPSLSPMLKDRISFDNCENLLPIETILSCQQDGNHLPTIDLIDLNNISKSMLCQTDSLDKNFDKNSYREMPFIKSEPTDELNATLFLMAMQKPGMSDLISDPLASLSKLYFKGFHKKHPQLFQQAIMAMASQDSSVFNQIAEQFPDIVNQLQCSPQNNIPLYPCATKQERERLQNSLIETMRGSEQNSEEGDSTPLIMIHNMEILPCVSPALRSMTPKMRNKLHDQYTTAITDLLKEYLGGTFRSTLYYRAHHALAPIFGVDRKKGHQESELVIDRDEAITPFVISSTPIILQQKTTTTSPVISLNGLLFVQELPSPTKQKEREITTENFHWRTGGTARSATVKFTPINGLQYVDTDADSPRYEDIWKDKTLYGLHITNEHDENIYDGLISHYAKKGYRIHPSHYIGNKFKPRFLNSYKSYLKNSIIKCKTDLIHKIAHSGGDALNLLSIPHKGNVVRLYKKRADNKTEVVDILYPAKKKSKKDFITNREFGEWIRTRDKKCKNQQLIYVNGSCNSADQKASNEILAARSPNFVDISSNTLNYLYPTYEKAGSLLVFDGLADNKTYSEIKEEIDRARPEGYEDFLFPNSSEYEEIIIGPIMESYDYEFIRTN